MHQHRSHQRALRFIASILLIQRRVKCLSRKEKAPSRSGFSLSTHVALKTRHVNPNIHVRRYQSYVRSLNLSATRPQLYVPTQSNNLIEVTLLSYTESVQSYIACFAILYSSTDAPMYLCMRLFYKVASSLLIPSSLENRSLQAEKFEGGKCKQ